jgi:hypothetical protein
MIVLKNTLRTQQVFNLSPCPGDGCETCFCTTQTTNVREALPDGTSGIRVTTKKLPGSITLLAGASGTYPDWVGSCTDVQRAIDRGGLSLVQITETQAPIKVSTSSKGKRSVL